MGTVKGKIAVTLYIDERTQGDIDKGAKKLGLSKSQYVEYELRKVFAVQKRKKTLKDK